MGHLMGMGGEGEPPESDKEQKLCSKWARDCRRQSGDTMIWMRLDLVKSLINMKKTIE